MPATVVHVMRTYGVHGGERQLGQMFSHNAGSKVIDRFVFLYRDDVCAKHFSVVAAGLEFEALLPFRARQFPSLAGEMIVLLLLLPVLQVRMIGALRRSGAKICVAHGLQAGAACWLAAWLMRGVKFVYVHRGTKSRAGSSSIFKLLYLPFDAVAGVSQASASSLQPLLMPGRVAIPLENGIDWAELDRQASECEKQISRPFTVIAVGRLMEGKGQGLIVRSFAEFRSRANMNVRLVFAGDGPDNAALKDLALELGVADCTSFLGSVRNVACELVQSDIFVHASETEGLSNAVLEAMAVGLPSVVVDAPGVTECHVKNETGYVVPRSAEALAAKLLILSSDPDLRSRLGTNARERARTKYSISCNVARYQALYEQLLEGA
jgi:glycosyltransferase involved in cell wall biosynthesis